MKIHEELMSHLEKNGMVDKDEELLRAVKIYHDEKHCEFLYKLKADGVDIYSKEFIEGLKFGLKIQIERGV